MDQAFLVGAVAAMVALPVGGIAYMNMDASAQHYDVPPAEARSLIANADLPTHVLGSVVKGSRVTLHGTDTVITALIASDGTELMRFVTTVEADVTGSSVSTVIEPPVGPHAERTTEVMQQHAYTMGLMELLAQEHVAAALERRPFNMLAMNPAGNAMLNADPEMKEHIAQANEAAAMMADMEQDTFHESGESNDWGASEGSDWGR